MFITVTSKYTVSSFKVWLYPIDPLVFLVFYAGKRHASTILHKSGLLTDLQRSAWHNNQSPSYLSIHLQATFSRQKFIPNLINYNETMRQSRVFVEWLVKEIKNYFKLVSLKRQDRIKCSWQNLLCVCMPYFKIQENVLWESNFWAFPVHLLRPTYFTLHCLSNFT